MDYQIEKTNFEGNQMLKQLIDLQNAVYPNRVFTEKNFNYWYNHNPMGSVISFNAFYEDKMIAHYACIPVKMNFDGRIVNGLLDIATVTHPDHRGKGLFKSLANETFNYAIEQKYEFIIGVANANSFPGYMKYFNFKYIGPLDVKIGFGNKIYNQINKKNSLSWNYESLKWRLTRSCNYFVNSNTIYTKLNFWKFRSILGIKAIMAYIPSDVISEVKTYVVKSRYRWIRPFNLYIGLGANYKKGFYISLPKFIKRSPFHLIFLDLTSGELPELTKENIFFQLMDFDVI